MKNNPDPSEWGKANDSEQGRYVPPIPPRPSRKPTLRPSRKTWFIFAGAVISLGVVGSLLPERTASMGTALPTTAPTPETVAPSTPAVTLKQTTPSIMTPKSTATAKVSGSEASLDWWFDQGGNQINSTISVLDQFVAAAQGGDLAGAQLYCSRLQAYVSTWSPQNLMALPDPNPAVGAELVQAFEDGRTGTYIAAGKCAKFFEKNDMGVLSESAQFAAASSTDLDKVQTGMLRLQGLTPPSESDTAEIANTECVGAKFLYEDLFGISCDGAKSILQTVLETGAPLGARSQVTADFECYESSFVEQTEGISDMTCWARDDEGQRDHIVLEANYR